MSFVTYFREERSAAQEGFIARKIFIFPLRAERNCALLRVLLFIPSPSHEYL